MSKVKLTLWCRMPSPRIIKWAIVLALTILVVACLLWPRLPHLA